MGPLHVDLQSYVNYHLLIILSESVKCRINNFQQFSQVTLEEAKKNIVKLIGFRKFKAYSIT